MYTSLTVREIVAAVLMTGRDAVIPASSLVADLGAESIDFLDLLFRLEDALGRRMPAARWQEFVPGSGWPDRTSRGPSRSLSWGSSSSASWPRSPG